MSRRTFSRFPLMVKSNSSFSGWAIFEILPEAIFSFRSRTRFAITIPSNAMVYEFLSFYRS